MREQRAEERTIEMKLGDNMTMEACNVWGDVAARKYRPPRIGEIPRRSAVDHPSPSDSPTKKNISLSDTEQLLTDTPGPSKVSSPEEYIQEVRKDSALYLEEGEGTPNILKPADTDVPRRQSSGYGGSFDDNNRRSSTTSGDNAQQQDLSPLLKERCRSRSRASIKNLVGRVEESIDEKVPVTGTSGERMPTTEIHRKVSGSGLDMPNIKEVKEVLREETLVQQDTVVEMVGGVAKMKLTRAKDHLCSVDAEGCKDVQESMKKNKMLQDRENTLLAEEPQEGTRRVRSNESAENMPRLIEVAKVQKTANIEKVDTGLKDSNCKKAQNTSVAATIAVDSSRIADTRKSSLPSEAGPSQRLVGNVASNVTDRPIYPRYPYSPYGSPQGSPRNRNRTLNRERSVGASICGFIDSQQDSQHLNQYKVLDEIGKGSFGVVKKVHNEEDSTYYAMKILSKRKLMKKAGIFGRMAPRRTSADPLANVYREIAILKKLDHPNVVKLVEVLDHPDKDNLYLVFELVHRGEILVIPTNNPLQEETARRYFRDVVMGVEYLHYQKIVHRDIKPSNLLVDRDDRIKIADLGVSTELREPGELLTGQAGTPAFAAPETTIANAEYAGPPCDVWSMGVTLYALVTGDLPWRASDSKAIQEVVRNEPLTFPSNLASPDLRGLIARMLEKSPQNRIVIPEMKRHPWLTNHATEPLPTETDNCRVAVTVTDEEVTKLGTLVLIKTMLKQHSFQNPFLPKRFGRTAGNDAEIASAESSAAGSEGGSSALRHDAMRDAKAERFHQTGRSNSAPDSYNWHRQVSVDNPLPPVTEASSQESEVERR
nr:PREDICTED: LOW QUALITY PROTEIN: calcium/calmodulin-dependent protein kinase kinase 1 [Linepithema humile]